MKRKFRVLSGKLRQREERNYESTCLLGCSNGTLLLKLPSTLTDLESLDHDLEVVAACQ
jgi:hypothetical protein